jgi:hypothetical protein
MSVKFEEMFEINSPVTMEMHALFSPLGVDTKDFTDEQFNKYWTINEDRFSEDDYVDKRDAIIIRLTKSLIINQ